MVSRTFARKQFLGLLLDGLTPIKKMCIWRDLATQLEIALSKHIDDEALAIIFEEKCNEIIKSETETVPKNKKESDSLFHLGLALSSAIAEETNHDISDEKLYVHGSQGGNPRGQNSGRDNV